MAREKVNLLLFLFLLCSFLSPAQDSLLSLSKNEYLGVVRKYHPVVKQAELLVERSKAEVLQARGAFDPVIDANLDRKTFDGKFYYSYFNPQLTIPTWYGIDLKAGAEEIAGERVTTEATLGTTTYAGVKVTANNLLFDRRRAVLRQAQAFRQLSEAEKLAMVNDLLYNALDAYWNWVREFRKYRIISEAIRVNEERLRFVRVEFEQGARPAIDTTEALAQLQNFYLQQNDAWLSFQNAGLELSNYLWLENNQPLQWNNAIQPAEDSLLRQMTDIPPLEELLYLAKTTHPKLQGLGYKLNMLEVDKRLKAQYLIPKVGVSANWLNNGYNVPAELSTTLLENNYKLGVDLSIPLFLREARGAYRSARIKIQETTLEQDIQLLQIENKVKSYYNEVLVLDKQIDVYEQAVQNYTRLLQGERLRFEVGESTLFLLNSRENKVLETSQKLVELKAKWHKSFAGLLWSAGQLN